MKPVAWINSYDLERLPSHDCWVNGQEHKNSVPLYTYPAKEIEALKKALQIMGIDADSILKEAQEK